MTPSLELRTRAETFRMLAGAYELHADNPANSPDETRIYNDVLTKILDIEQTLERGADAIDERAGFRLRSWREEV